MTTLSTGPFVLGTVQLGLDYGIANQTGQPDRNAAFALLDAAVAAGVATLDTAHAYGSSEAVIGEWLRARRPAVSVITKVPPLQGAGLARAEAGFDESLSRLGLRSVAGLLLHRSGDWATEGLPAWAERLSASGRFTDFGVSIYDPTEIPDDPRIGMVQLPVNAFSPQIVRSREIDRLRERGAKIFVRSVFAQGLLLQSPREIPDDAPGLKPPLARLRAIAAEAGVSPAALAMAAVRRLLPEAHMVLGAETAAQVTELATAATTSVPRDAADALIALGHTLEPGLFDPRRRTRPAKAHR